MFSNKKGVEPIAVIMTIVIVLVVGYLLINVSTGKIKSSAGELDSLLSGTNANCDPDNDNLKGKDDPCPCDHKDLLDSQIFYIQTATQKSASSDVNVYSCPVSRRCIRDTQLERKTFADCSIGQTLATTDGAVNWEYYFSLANTGCKNWYTTSDPNEGKNRMNGLLRQYCASSVGTTTTVTLTPECAKYVLTSDSEGGEPTYTCKTSTKVCKSIINKQC